MKLPCMKMSFSCMIFMHGNDNSMHENEGFAPGMIFSDIFMGIYTCTLFHAWKSNPRKCLGKIFIFMHENFIFLCMIT